VSSIESCTSKLTLTVSYFCNADFSFAFLPSALVISLNEFVREREGGGRGRRKIEERERKERGEREEREGEREERQKGKGNT
jgi:hypothetical protein